MERQQPTADRPGVVAEAFGRAEQMPATPRGRATAVDCRTRIEWTTASLTRVAHAQSGSRARPIDFISTRAEPPSAPPPRLHAHQCRTRLQPLLVEARGKNRREMRARAESATWEADANRPAGATAMLLYLFIRPFCRIQTCAQHQYPRNGTAQPSRSPRITPRNPFARSSTTFGGGKLERLAARRR